MYHTAVNSTVMINYLGKLKVWRVFFILGNEKVTQACDIRKSTLDCMNRSLKRNKT